MTSNQQQLKPDLNRYSSLIEPIFRYLLVRSEDYLAAQAYTLNTFRQVLKWKTAESENDLVRAMAMARYQQAHGKRLRISIPADPIPPDQEEIRLREQVGRLADAWKHIPHNQADAMALHYFGGLSLAQTGEVLGKNAAEIQDLISQASALEDELYHLASEIHPPDGLVAGLVDEFSDLPVDAPPPIPSRWGSAWFWRTIYTLKEASSAGVKAGQAGLLVALLVVGLYVVLHQQALPQTPASTPTIPTPTPTPTQTSAPLAYTLLEIPNALVPPAPAVCQVWKTNMENLMMTDFIELDSQPFSDPTGDNPGISGRGCELTAEISGPGQENAPKTARNINWLFRDNNFGLGPGFDSFHSSPDNVFFPQDCPGFGRVFQKSHLFAFLSISYCTNNSNLATAVPPNQDFVRGYTIRMFLATGTVQSDLTQFFNFWAAGSNQAISYLSPDMSKYFQSVRGLDRQVGISRTISSQIQFNWQPVENLGNSLQIVVWINELGSPSQLWSVIPSFQIDLAQEGGTWQVTNVTKTIQVSAVSRPTPQINATSPK